MYKFDKSFENFAGLHWVLGAVAKKSSVLQKLLVAKDGRYVATDARRMHLYSPETEILPAGVYTIYGKKKTEIVLGLESELCQDDYPDCERILAGREGAETIPFPIAKASQHQITVEGMHAEIIRKLPEGTTVDPKLFVAASEVAMDSYSISENSNTGLLSLSLYGEQAEAVIALMRYL